MLSQEQKPEKNQYSYRNYTITHKFSNEKYHFHRIPIPLCEREYTTEDDLFQNPIYTCLKKIRFPEPNRKEKVRFNVFNLTRFEYYFEIFELTLNELPEFIWYLEEFGYSDHLLEKFNENTIESDMEVIT